MNFSTSFMTSNPHFQDEHSIHVHGIVLHSVGNAQPSSKVMVNNWNRETFKRLCAHAFIDANTANVVQTLPWTYYAPHCNSEMDSDHIGIWFCEFPEAKQIRSGEILIDDKRRSTIQKKVENQIESAAALCRDLCFRYRFNPEQIFSCGEVFALGRSNRNVDPFVIWNRLGIAITPDDFRNKIKMEGSYDTNSP